MNREPVVREAGSVGSQQGQPQRRPAFSAYATAAISPVAAKCLVISRLAAAALVD